MSDNKLNEMISGSLEQIREIAGTDTVVGSPITTPSGTVIIPVSKISMGFASGGVDYLPKSVGTEKAAKPAAAAPSGERAAKPASSGKSYFGGGGGTGISVTPICFLVVKADGEVELLNVADNTPVPTPVGIIDSVSSFLEKSPDLISRMKSTFSKKKNVDSPLDDDVIRAASPEPEENEDK